MPPTPSQPAQPASASQTTQPTSLTSPARAFLGLGSNLGDSQGLLVDALDFLSEQLAPDHLTPSQPDAGCATGLATTGLVAVSSLYRSEPIGGPSDSPPFLNLVAQVQVEQSPYELLQICQQAEQQAQRVRIERWGPRTLDVDVLLYGDLRLDDPMLTIPHPRMLERRFVTDPLAELDAELVERLLAELDPTVGAELAAKRSQQDCVSIGPVPWQPLASPPCQSHRINP